MPATARIYNYFKYSLPTESVEVYVHRALAVLADIKQQFPQFYGSFRSPSEVLTLSGVRAFDTYYDLGTAATREHITGIKQLLKAHGVILLEENFPFGRETYPDNRYSLVHLAAFNDIPQRYKHLPEPGWKPPDFSRLDHDNDFFLWWATWQRSILLVEELDATCKAWLARGSWMPHDLTFGVLLGYPGEAICSVLYEPDSFDEASRTQRVAIAHAAKFEGAEPGYWCAQEIINSPVIVKHQRLWSDILDGVYRVVDESAA